MLQLKAAVAAVTAERDELQSMVQQAATEMQSVQQKVEEGSSQQVRKWGLPCVVGLGQLVGRQASLRVSVFTKGLSILQGPAGLATPGI